jgi:hypothetical protein
MREFDSNTDERTHSYPLNLCETRGPIRTSFIMCRCLTLNSEKNTGVVYIASPHPGLAVATQGTLRHKVGPLNREYDIFERLPDGTDLWKDYVHGLEQAHRRLQELAAQSKNEHYAIHTPTKEIAARVNVRQS